MKLRHLLLFLVWMGDQPNHTEKKKINKNHSTIDSKKKNKQNK